MLLMLLVHNAESEKDIKHDLVPALFWCSFPIFLFKKDFRALLWKA